ncbi:MAG: hypothetical protein DDT42_02140 [candidate division WS2 bacterium]|uniref:Uncharacterized protein n=1 Tax=Psychracetigena formicireducens TaxID=2986056 RepID=A0A9E2BIL3_PSYF1|nr:hypothetical protein [Candidatus Psychracetigena formicireducens]
MGKTYFKGGQRAEVITQTLTPVSLGAASCVEQTFTVAGLLTTDVVSVYWPGSATAVGLVGARVSAANTLALTFVNPTAGALTPTAGSYRIQVWATV